MLKVSAILSVMVLAAGIVLLAGGKYPAFDERGLHLAKLPAGFVSDMVDMKAGLETTLAKWTGRAGELLAGLAAKEPDVASNVSPGITAVAATQQQIIARLDALAATVDTLQVRLDRQQAAQVTSSVTQQAEQALQLKAVTAQLVELQQQTAAEPVAGESRRTPTPETGDWVVNVASSSREGPIKALQHKLRQQDIRTELQRMDVQGKPRYRLRVTGFSSGGEARRYANRLQQHADLKGAWASKR